MNPTTRYNWGAVIQGVAFLTDEPSADGLKGNGFTVNRVDATTISITIIEGDFSPPAVPPIVVPPVETVPTGASESADNTVDFAPLVQATPENPAGIPAVAEATGQGTPENPAMPTGQAAANLQAQATGQ